MEQLISSYNAITSRIKDYRNRIDNCRRKIRELENGLTDEVPGRISNLEETLERVDDYLLRIKGFIDLAEQHMTSRNELTIEAPKGYRVNLSRLKRWATMIDPLSRDDAYAKRLHLVAKCDEKFLLKKQAEFKARIKELETELGSDSMRDVEQLKEEAEKISADLKEYIMSSEVADFLNAVQTANNEFWYRMMPTEFGNSQEAPAEIVLGSEGKAFGTIAACDDYVKQNAGTFYDKDSQTIYLPFAIDNSEEFALIIKCQPGRKLVAQLDSGLRNFLFSVIDKSPAGSRKVHILDAERFSTALSGELRKLEGSFALGHIPRNPEQLSEALESLASTIPDIDEVIEAYDTVAEYNRDNPPEKHIVRDIVVLIGYPYAFTGKDRELANKIISGYERYGMSYITVGIMSDESRARSSSDISEYAEEAAIHIKITSERTTIRKGSEETSSFAWYPCDAHISEEYISSFNKADDAIEDGKIGNEYTERYSLTDRPAYIRQYKSLDLPIGIDGKGQEQNISFENENFATYLVGAAGSGKSTLLHTLIAGLIRNYHPDNVELWLADFKQVEFKRYMKHLPPHVKYILLDESPELVYDLIDKLTEIMMERQRLGIKGIDKIDPSTLNKPLPVIFVILDEFSIMSQSIADSPIYKLRLQNLLAKGRALGIKFLFSSQTFTTGVAGLSSTARAQIQQRIAMKGSNEEISSTLELSSSLKTDQVRNWMEALPPHYALIKYRLGADTLPLVKRLLVMYFKDYDVRDNMIDDINSKMHAVSDYDPKDLSSFVEKRPVLVDGNSFSRFSLSDLRAFINERGRTKDEFFLSLGVPRLMTPIRPIVLSSETRENVLMIAMGSELACGASVIMSSIKSFASQGGKVRIWAYPKHPLYASYKPLFEREGFEAAEGIDEVCDEIREVKKMIQSGVTSETLYVLIGMDRICMDFEFADGTAVRDNYSRDPITAVTSFEKAEAADKESPLMRFLGAWNSRGRQLKKELRAKGLSAEEVKARVSAAKAEFEAEFFKGKDDEYSQYLEEIAAAGGQKTEGAKVPEADNAKVASKGAENNVPTKAGSEEPPRGAYNATNDFAYIMKQGSRNGIHFFMTLNSAADLKPTGLKADYFRHKLMFRISAEDSRLLIGNKAAAMLPERVCMYDDTLSRFSFRPYIHDGIGWDGWELDENGDMISPYADIDN